MMMMMMMIIIIIILLNNPWVFKENYLILFERKSNNISEE